MTAVGIQFDTILHIGAGSGDDVAAWLDAGVQRVVLVEPNPACSPALAALAAQNPAITHVEAALAAQDGEGLLHVFNLARYSSLSAATGLTEILPGLRQVALLPVATLTAASLLARLGPLPGRVALIVDAPGCEQVVLQSCQSAGLLDQLATIILTCGEEPNYDGAIPRPALQAWLEAAGFAVTQTDATDPDWPRLTLQVDERARRITDLTAQLQQTNAALTASQSEAEAQVQSLAEQARITGAQADEITELRSLLQQAATDHDLLSRHQAEAQDRISLLAAELAHAEQAIAAHQSAAAAQSAALNEAETRAASAAEQIDALQTGLGTANLANHGLTEQIATLTAQLTERDQTITGHIATAERLQRMLDDSKSISAARAKAVQALEATLAERDQSALAAEADHAAQIAEFEGRITTLDTDLATARKGKTDLENTLTEARTHHEARKARIIELENRVKTLDAEIDAERQRSSALETALTEAQSQTAARQSELAELDAHSKIMFGEIDIERQRNAALDLAMTELRGNHEARRARVTELESRIKALEPEIDAARRHSADLNAALAETRKALEARTEEKAAALTQIEDQRKRMAALELGAKTAAADITTRTDAMAKQAERIKELEFRQTLSRDELRRAEGQLDLIKDLLLRGDRL